MKKTVKVFVIILLVIIVVLIIALITEKIIANKVERLNHEADIYIDYFDGQMTDQAKQSGKYILIKISEGKLYVIDWFNNKLNNKSIYFLESKSISDENINELLKMIEEAPSNDNDSVNRVLTGSITYYNVRYNGKNIYLKELPFSY